MHHPSNFFLLETLRYDPAVAQDLDGVFLCEWHYERLVRSCKFFGWPGPGMSLDEFRERVHRAVKGERQSLKVRLRLRPDEILVETSPVPAVADLLDGLAGKGGRPPWHVYVDTRATPASAFTMHKTTSREHYNAARLRAGIASAGGEEVLLWNDKGQVMEGSITNVAFERNGQWTTPELGSGCLPGVCRRYLIAKGAVTEGTISKDSVGHGESVLLFNAVQGVVRGIIC